MLLLLQDCFQNIEGLWHIAIPTLPISHYLFLFLPWQFDIPYLFVYLRVDLQHPTFFWPIPWLLQCTQGHSKSPRPEWVCWYQSVGQGRIPGLGYQKTLRRGRDWSFSNKCTWLFYIGLLQDLSPSRSHYRLPATSPPADMALRLGHTFYGSTSH